MVCAAVNKWDEYGPTDKTTEAKYAFTLADALLRARENEGRLFEGLVFHITPRVSTDTKLLKNVVAAHGGKVHFFRYPCIAPSWLTAVVGVGQARRAHRALAEGQEGCVYHLL
jgi:hypothetical protein